jgi:hypothetical protein
VSARNPLTILNDRIRKLHRTAYYIKKLRVRRKAAEWIRNELRVELTDKFFEDAILGWIEQAISNKMDQTDFHPTQADFFTDYDDLYFGIKIDGQPGQIVLGDVDEDSMPKIIKTREGNINTMVNSLAELRKAWERVQPILSEHPGWKWRDAVKWMSDHGGVPTT